MGLVDRINVETRTMGGVPWQPWRNPYWKFNIGGPVHPSREVQGQDNVLGLAAVYAAVRYIADAVASLPIKVYRQNPDGTSTRIYSTMLLGSPVAGGGPQISGTLYSWLFTGTTSALLWGNAWGLITNRGGIPGPDGLGLPTGISWLPPERVAVQDDEQQPENPLRARIYYMGHLMNREDLVHLPAFTVAGRVEAISPMRAFSSLWAQGMEALEYSADWFRNGGFPPGTFRNSEEQVDETQSKEIRRMLTDTLRLHQPLVFGKDWEYTPISVPPNEAAFIQAMQLNATQVAAVYGVRPQRVGGTRNDGLTYSNQVMDMLDEVTNTLRPWLIRWEHLLTMLLPQTQYCEFDTDALLRGDPRARAEIYQIHRAIGSRTANEVRADDDLPEVIGGDDPIPLPVLERMISTTRAFPKAYLPLVDIEAEKIANMVLKLEEDHPDLFNPATALRPPFQATAPQYLAKLITQVRAGQPIFGPPEGPVEDSDRASAVTMIHAYHKLGKIGDREHASRLQTAVEAKTAGELAGTVEGLPPLLDGDVADAGVPTATRQSFGDPAIRASDDDRAMARRMLAHHHHKGRLRDHELEDRSRRAAEAVTCGDLGTLFADLPAEQVSANPPEEDRSGEPPQPLFGPAALALLHSRSEQFELAARAAQNGKGH